MQRGFTFFVSACLALLFFFRAPGAFAQSATAPAQSATAPAIYVVDVNGDRVDAARMRAAIGRELGVTAVAPTDARATSATGTISIETDAADRTLKVTFHKQEAPVTRVVPLPDDQTRAEVAAMYLASNLARDEAGELLGRLKEPNAEDTPVPAAAPAAVATTRDDEDLRILRATLKEKAVVSKRQVRAVEGALVGAGVVAASAGLFLLEVRPSTPETRSFGNELLIGGGMACVLAGVGDLTFTPNPSVELQKQVEEIAQGGGSSVQVLAAIDAAWAQRAEQARSGRVRGSTTVLVLGGLLAGGGFVLAPKVSPDSTWSGVPALLFGFSAVEIGIGVYGLLSKSPVESDYQSWHNIRQPQATTGISRPSFAFSPLPGGGAASLGFSF